jgi:DNA-binding CsgD family transcriptional regulator
VEDVPIVNQLQSLRSAIVDLTSFDDLERRKNELLALVDALSATDPSHGNGNGNGNGHAHGNGHGDGNGNGHSGLHRKLSPREREVMTMILDGRRLKEIAATLDISVKTVTTHRSRLLRKLGIEDNLSLYRYGVRNGLISV